MKEDVEVRSTIRQVIDEVRKNADVPVGAGRLEDDLSKVADSDVIGKGGESDLRK